MISLSQPVDACHGINNNRPFKTTVHDAGTNNSAEIINSRNENDEEYCDQ